MANSAGGVIIYGIKEFDEVNKSHLPEKIDPIDRASFSREWLEQVINTIRPRIDGLIITPVSINASQTDAVYIVEVPQSMTAHQATDYRYYKRFNFQSVPMEDYEVRDVMSRHQHPKIDLEFTIERLTRYYSTGVWAQERVAKEECELNIKAKNNGDVFAQYVSGFVRIPEAILKKQDEYGPIPYEIQEDNGHRYYNCRVDNTVRDVVDVELSFPDSIEKYGPSRYEPLLPRLSMQLQTVTLDENLSQPQFNEAVVEWIVFADNARPRYSKIQVSKIPVIDKRVTSR